MKQPTITIPTRRFGVLDDTPFDYDAPPPKAEPKPRESEKIKEPPR